MKGTLSVVSLWFVLTAIAATPEDAVLVSKANNKFARNIYKVLSSTSGNMLFSPLSAHGILSLAYQGSGGDTETKLSEVLNLPTKAQAADGYSTIFDSIKNPTEVELTLANKLYLKKKFTLNPDFKTIATEKFQSDVESIDFASSAEAAATINSWVASKTADKINNLFNSDAFNELTSLVLVNTLYFKGQWFNPFLEDYTKPETFYLNDNDTVEAEMMVNVGEFRSTHHTELESIVLELPFEDKSYSMVLIVPYSKEGLRAVEEKIVDADFNDIMNSLETKITILRMPKFKINYSIDLKQVLTQLGLDILFDEENCNLSGLIQEAKNIFVSDASQKVIIDVNEKGCEAAAASELKTTPRSLHERLTIDRPFIFTILKRSEEQVTILFAGRLYNPNE